VSLVATEDHAGVIVLALDRPPANAFDAELVSDLSLAFKENTGARALILLSVVPSMFSAGWDLPFLVRLGRREMEGFLESFCDLARQIFVFGPPVIAVLPGHAIAGGLILAAAADERYAARGKGQLGLSEVVLGLPLPQCCLEIFRHAIGPRAAERLAATGENLSVEEAARIGLVDRVVEPDELFDRALERARFLAGRPAQPHSAIKRRARASALARFDEARRGDPFLDFWFGADAAERVAELVAKLTKK